MLKPSMNVPNALAGFRAGFKFEPCLSWRQAAVWTRDRCPRNAYVNLRYQEALDSANRQEEDAHTQFSSCSTVVSESGHFRVSSRLTGRLKLLVFNNLLNLLIFMRLFNSLANIHWRDSGVDGVGRPAVSLGTVWSRWRRYED